MKRNVLVVLISITLLSLVFAIGVVSVLKSHRTYASPATAEDSKAVHFVSTITGLKRIAVVGSTALIVDAKGRTITADANPYGIAIAPSTIPASNQPGSVKPGDIIVSNIGGNDTGTTLVRFPNKMGPGLLFNSVPNAGTKGPADQAFNSTSGTDWVANVSGNNVQVFK